MEFKCGAFYLRTSSAIGCPFPKKKKSASEKSQFPSLAGGPVFAARNSPRLPLPPASKRPDEKKKGREKKAHRDLWLRQRGSPESSAEKCHFYVGVE